MESAQLPSDLQKYFVSLEQQASAMLRSGDYELSENVYRLMLNMVLDRQRANGRIHKGSYYHHIGFCLVLWKKLKEALLNFLLAYIEDTINTEVGHEDDADREPASRVLRESFHLRNSVFDNIKKSLHRKKELALLKNYLKPCSTTTWELVKLQKTSCSPSVNQFRQPMTLEEPWSSIFRPMPKKLCSKQFLKETNKL